MVWPPVSLPPRPPPPPGPPLPDPLGQLLVLLGLYSRRDTLVLAQLLFPNNPIASTWGDLQLPRVYPNARRLLFAPCNASLPDDPVWAVAQHVVDDFGGEAVCIPCNTASECGDSMDHFYLNYQRSVLAGVAFGADTNAMRDPGTNVSYFIRMDGDVFLDGFNGTTYVRSYNTAPDPSVLVYNPWFVPVQRAVERGILALRNGGAVPIAANVRLSVTQFPEGSYYDNQRAAVISFFLPVTLLPLYLGLLGYGVYGQCGWSSLHSLAAVFDPFPALPAWIPKSLTVCAA